jgi:hypothetical protein
MMDAIVNVVETACEHCGTLFLPRKDGGRAQRFCSRTCRFAWHRANAEPNVLNVLPNVQANVRNVASTCTLQTSPAVGVQPADETRAERLLLAAQEPVTASRDERGDLILRQHRWPDADAVIVVNADYEQQFLDALCDLMGVVSMP